MAAMLPVTTTRKPRPPDDSLSATDFRRRKHTAPADNPEPIRIDRVAKRLASRGDAPVFGACPRKRLIQKEVLDPLAAKVQSGGLRDGETVVDAEGGRLGSHATMNQAPLVA